MPKTKSRKLLRAIHRYRNNCDQCPYLKTCTLAPVALRVDIENQDREAHPHAHKLQKYVDSLQGKYPKDWRQRLVDVLDDEDDATLLAGCILWQGLADDPEAALDFVRSAAERELGPRQRGPLLRIACGLGGEAYEWAQENLYPEDPEDPEDGLPFRAGSFFLQLLLTRASGADWERDCRNASSYVYARSFAIRDIDPSSSSLDLFAEVEESGEVRLFYFRRDIHGHASLSPVTKIRIDSLLRQVFKVFASPESKSTPLFADICEYTDLNVDVYERRLMSRGLAALPEDDVFLLASRSEQLAAKVEEHQKVPGLAKLVAVSHQCLLEGEEKGRIDQVLFERRKQVREAYAHTGEETFKKLCKAIFRLADASRRLADAEQTTPRLAEIWYYMTALVGLNGQGILKALGGENPKAYLAFGLMPPVPDPRDNFKRMVAVLKEEKLKKRVRISVDQGLRHMAAQHGFDDPEAFAEALRDWEVRDPDPGELVPEIELPREQELTDAVADSDDEISEVEVLEESSDEVEVLGLSDDAIEQVLSDESQGILEADDEGSEIDIASSDAVRIDGLAGLGGSESSFEEQFDSVADIDAFEVPWFEHGDIQFEDAVEIPDEELSEEEAFELPPAPEKGRSAKKKKKKRAPEDDTAFALEMIRLEDEEAQSASGPEITPPPTNKKKKKPAKKASKKPAASGKKKKKTFKAPKRRTSALDRRRGKRS